MKDENKVVAELYARLWPWLDHAKPARLMFDDGGKGAVAHPDMCVHFDGSNKSLRMEFKIVNCDGSNKHCIEPSVKQLLTWADETSELRPHLWIAKLEDSEKYFIWTHEDFAAAFMKRSAANTTRRAVAVPAEILKNPLSFTKLFLAVMQYAVANGFVG